MHNIDIENYIVDIENSDRATGWMVRQIFDSAKDEKWYVAMSSFFMLMEQVLRWATDIEDDKKLEKVIEYAFEQNIVNDNEKEILHQMRWYRNKYTHSNFHGNAFEIGGLIYQVNDSETAEKIFEILSEPLLRIITKLTKINL